MITGAGGNDTLIGGAGADRLSGGDGSDVYYVDSSLDVVVETNAAVGTGGNDRVFFSGQAGTFALGANVEALTLEGSAAINGTGNALSNTLTGNSAANTLSGLGGNDVINGGYGNDVLWGGAGLDKFIFESQLSSTGNVDQIGDYRVKDDVIYLENAIFTALSTVGYLASASFVSNTAGLAMDAFDRIVYETDTGYLRYDSDGTGAGESVLFAKLAPNLAMSASEFFIT